MRGAFGIRPGADDRTIVSSYVKHNTVSANV